MTWNHRVLIVIVSLPGKQVILIHLLLDVGHVPVSFKRLAALYLSVEVLLVHYDVSILLIDPVLIEHAVENVHSVGLIAIILPLSLVQSGLLELVIVQLFEELSVVFILELLMVIGCDCCSLVQHLLSVGICLCLVEVVL